MNLFDPLKRARDIEGIVTQGLKRKYYRVSRPGRWYGGIASADCCGCNLKCVFCWSDKPRENPEKYGDFCSPDQVAERIIKCARDHNYRLVRISGNEPTVAKAHLLKVISLINKTNFLFILETNGTLLDEDFVQELAKFRNLHVRVSLKGTNPDEFSMLTGAIPNTFDRILGNLALLMEYQVDFNLAVMLSFSPDKHVTLLEDRLKQISPDILKNFEEEYVFLYPHVAKKMKRAGIEPLVAYTPRGVPKKLV
ncbi:hypothetical protein AMJ83_00885 [candidate division WOR_3 bacterium SM23_42]|uniref:Radical SAM core domain-containing protein n=1 Tax=candidate division WOR_3 bacterium SM23_42 TaxID=1703779 RepID=A0A0S8FVS5_UNCW3|nr:MAG: hypothetical protein AMJ83_00885 [candidate division WOR_3 bacterium SM23_42]